MHELSTTELIILRLIPAGSGRKITTKQIKKVTGISIRNIRDVIRGLVLKGIPIVSDRTSSDRGFYIATTEDERRAGMSQFNNQLNDMARRKRAIQNADLNGWRSTIKEG
ncbi:hypothetical protein [Companilactobacillus kedongensis]|uniref:hypothetical protein n=1 Tax=Companilactobacillus kedongensis TaxID=2486004 RepID=UPI000F79DC73|nr:hypothetical protein [Companilactobacillus kedongensis]